MVYNLIIILDVKTLNVYTKFIIKQYLIIKFQRDE